MPNKRLTAAELVFLILALVVILAIGGHAQTAGGTQVTTFTSATTATAINLQGSGVLYHRITWTVSGTVSPCSVQVDSSADGSTWNTGDIVPAQDCSANNNSNAIQFNANYARVNVTSFTGTGSVTVVWQGFTTAPSGGGGGGGGGGTVTPLPNNQLISGGGLTWTGGLGFRVAAATYQIATNQYTSLEQPITLDTADPTNPRFDVIALDTTGTLVKITGTPAVSPAVPSVDPTLYLQIGLAQVNAGATTPVITNEPIYSENVEWTCTPTAHFNCASTSSPYQGTYNIEATAAVTGNSVTLVKPAAGSVTLSNYTGLSFYIENKAAWASARSLTLAWYNGTTQVGTAISFKNGVYGFNQTNTAGYQLIVIPAGAFLTGSSTPVATTLKATVAGGGGGIGFHLDVIQLQSNTAGGSTGTNGTVTNVGGVAPIVVSNGTTTPVVSCPTCGTGTGTVTSVATTSPITGGTITGSGTIACATCAVKVASGTATLNPGAISSGTCATVVTASATGTLTTDVVTASFNGDPTGITGFAPSSSGTLTIIVYPTADTFNAKECNNTGGSITPGSVTLNWRVSR